MRKRLSRAAAGFYRAHRKSVLDVILYGSAVRGKPFPRDVDVAVIFRRFDRKEFYDAVYDLKKALERLGVRADVKGFMLEDIFDRSLFIRPSLFVEGVSLVRKRRLGESLGFFSGSVFLFSLGGMTASQKTRFQYALKGRGGRVGILAGLKGRHLGRGTVLVPIENSEKFADFLRSWKAEYEEMRGLFVRAA